MPEECQLMKVHTRKLHNRNHLPSIFCQTTKSCFCTAESEIHSGTQILQIGVEGLIYASWKREGLNFKARILNIPAVISARKLLSVRHLTSSIFLHSLKAFIYLWSKCNNVSCEWFFLLILGKTNSSTSRKAAKSNLPILMTKDNTVISQILKTKKNHLFRKTCLSPYADSHPALSSVPCTKHRFSWGETNCALLGCDLNSTFWNRLSRQSRHSHLVLTIVHNQRSTQSWTVQSRHMF